MAEPDAMAGLAGLLNRLGDEWKRLYHAQEEAYEFRENKIDAIFTELEAERDRYRECLIELLPRYDTEGKSKAIINRALKGWS